MTLCLAFHKQPLAGANVFPAVSQFSLGCAVLYSSLHLTSQVEKNDQDPGQLL